MNTARDLGEMARCCLLFLPSLFPLLSSQVGSQAITAV